jgi:hypothetical protein
MSTDASPETTGDESALTDLKEQAKSPLPGKEAHGGDVAPPNSDDAGRRVSPESGPPDKA